MKTKGKCPKLQPAFASFSLNFQMAAQRNIQSGHHEQKAFWVLECAKLFMHTPKILRWRFHLRQYCLQTVQGLRRDDQIKWTNFCIALQEAMEVDTFTNRLVFGDEAAVHFNGDVNHHNIRVWVGTEHGSDLQKLGVSKIKVYILFFSSKKIMFDTTYVPCCNCCCFRNR